MNFLAPERLALLLLVAALAGLYVWVQRRRRHAAVRFTNVALLAEVAPARPGWRRHVPAAAVALALAALVVSIAEPVHSVRVPKDAATIMLTIDVSASMDATDVAPTRLQAAVAAAKTFVNDLPPQVRIGLISFSRTAQVIASPTGDHQAVVDGIDRLILGTGTATGDAIYTALDALAAANDTAGAAPTTKGGSAIVLLSDGVPTVGRPWQGAAQEAANQGVPISTISFGTSNGVVNIQGTEQPVPVDDDLLREVAQLTHGDFYKAVTGEQLKQVYASLRDQIGYTTEQSDASKPWLILGTLLALTAGGASLFIGQRLPA